MKLSSETLPTGELVFLRGVLMLGATVSIAAATGAFRQAWRLLAFPVLLRAIGDVGSSLSFQAALGRMPLADVVSINQANPLLVTAASAVFLGEKVGWRRWTATAIGFLGVLLIVRPGTTAFTWWSVLALVAVLFSTMRDVTTKRIDTAVPAVLILVLAYGAVSVGSLTLLPFETWSRPTPLVAVQIAGSAMFTVIGHFCIIFSVRTGDLSAVVPFRFSIVLWAMIFGYLVWGTLPAPLTLVGIVIVASAGIYTFHREMVVRRRAVEKSQSS